MTYHPIQSQTSSCKFTTRLVSESDDGRELGIALVRQNIDLHGISDHDDLRTILGDVLYGIQWLHHLGIIHHDTRQDNILGFSGVFAEGGRSLPRGMTIDCGDSIASHQAKPGIQLKAMTAESYVATVIS